MAESIDFQFPMKKACAWEISSFCKDVPSGHARVMRCVEGVEGKVCGMCEVLGWGHCANAIIRSQRGFCPLPSSVPPCHHTAVCHPLPPVRCLEEHIDNTDMSRECKAEVRATDCIGTGLV